MVVSAFSHIFATSPMVCSVRERFPASFWSVGRPATNRFLPQYIAAEVVPWNGKDPRADHALNILSDMGYRKFKLVRQAIGLSGTPSKQNEVGEIF